jgi:hypothetical protein
MSKSTAIAVACGLAALVVADGIAFPQAGSTGGTLGKTDKSASGGEELHPAKRRVAKPQTVSPCAKVPGAWTWRWMGNTARVELKPNGTATNSNGNEGLWTCTSGVVRVTWDKGGGPDNLTPSSNGKLLSGTGMIGVVVTGNRN